MTRFTRFAAAALVGAALISAPAFAASPAVGSWDLSVDTQMGKLKATMTVAENGDGYSVEIVDAPMEAPEGAPQMGPMESTISEVAVNGNALTFKRHLSSDQFQVDLAYALTVDGDTLSGKAGSDFGDSQVSGTRSK